MKIFTEPESLRLCLCLPGFKMLSRGVLASGGDYGDPLVSSPCRGQKVKKQPQWPAGDGEACRPEPRLNRAAAAAAKSLQSCPTLCDPIDSSPPGSPVPGILQARILEWVAISFSSAWKWKVKVKLLSRVQLLATSWTAAYQAPPSMGFSRQEYWSGVPLPSPLKRALSLNASPQFPKEPSRARASLPVIQEKLEI